MTKKKRNEFPVSIRKKVMKRAGNRCDRCWSKRDLEYHHKIPVSMGGDSSIENCIVLCHNCHSIAPSDPFLLEKFFLRFASIKEMIQYYNVNDEKEVMKSFSREIGVKYKDFKKFIKEDPMSHISSIKQGMRKFVDIFGHSGFNIPYGYNYIEQRLKINSKESNVVKDIYRWYVNGKSICEIVKMLNYSKIPSKKEGLWAKKTISKILKNPIYCGYHRFEEKIYKGNPPKIIDLESYKKVQSIIEEKGGIPKIYNFN